MKISSYIKAKLRSYAKIKVAENIVIIESDDWGMWRAPRDSDFLTSLGKSKIWAKDTLENLDELEAVYLLLEKYAAQFKNVPFIVPNMVVSNPDFDATKINGYKNLVLLPLYNQYPELVKKYKEGIARKVFFPQYHGRFHFNYKKYLQLLQTDDISRKIFEANFHAGINNLSDSNWKLHSEYIDWETGECLPNLDEWLSEGISDFEKTFGYSPKSQIAPQYIFHPKQANSFVKQGITTFQGCNMQQFKQGVKSKQLNLPQGSTMYYGIVAFGRNVKFEPARGVAEWKANTALKHIERLFKQKEPVIIDTHRINYVGQFANTGISEFELLLKGLANKNVRFMSTVELSQALLNDGKYTNVFTGEQQKIEIIKPNFFSKTLRNYLT